MKKTLRIPVDIALLLLLPVLMTEMLMGQQLHEWVGTVSFILFVLHHILNFRWWKTLTKGTYTPVRCLLTVLDLLLVADILALMVSGIMMSGFVFDWLNIRGGISECICEDECAGGGKINYSPVKNTYDALWTEYRTATDSISLLNVTRRILEYYYLQICGYSGDNLRSDLLERNRPDFEVILPDGNIDKTDYNIAVAMIAVMNIGARGFNDGLYFDVSAIAPAQIRVVFEKIFVATKQKQHYDMMMNLR